MCHWRLTNNEYVALGVDVEFGSSTGQTMGNTHPPNLEGRPFNQFGW